MQTLRFQPNVPAEVRAIDQRAALCIPKARHRYAETGEGRVKPLKVEFGVCSVSASATTASRFDEATDTITVHRIPDRKDAYQ